MAADEAPPIHGRLVNGADFMKISEGGAAPRSKQRGLSWSASNDLNWIVLLLKKKR